MGNKEKVSDVVIKLLATSETMEEVQGGVVVFRGSVITLIQRMAQEIAEHRGLNKKEVKDDHRKNNQED